MPSDYLAWIQHPWLLSLCRWLLAAVFSISALRKQSNRRGFVVIVQRYEVLPGRWARYYATALPWIELAVGVMLLVGLGTKLAAALSGVLLLSFIVAVGINLLRGRQHLSCGCSGARHERKISGRILVRNSLLLMLALQIMVWGQDSPLSLRLISVAAPFLLRNVILVGWGLPLTFAISGLAMTALFIRQLLRFVHLEGRR